MRVSTGCLWRPEFSLYKHQRFSPSTGNSTWALRLINKCFLPAVLSLLPKAQFLFKRRSSDLPNKHWTCWDISPALSDSGSMNGCVRDIPLTSQGLYLSLPVWMLIRGCPPSMSVPWLSLPSQVLSPTSPDWEQQTHWQDLHASPVFMCGQSFYR